MTYTHVRKYDAPLKSRMAPLAQQRKSGVRVMFFVTEHSRISTSKREVG